MLKLTKNQIDECVKSMYVKSIKDSYDIIHTINWTLENVEHSIRVLDHITATKNGDNRWLWHILYVLAKGNSGDIRVEIPTVDLWDDMTEPTSLWDCLEIILRAYLGQDMSDRGVKWLPED